MKNTLFRSLTALTLGTALAGLSTSCTKDLEQKPQFEVTPDKVYTSLAGYKQVLSKLYGGFAVTGQKGPADAGDIADIDEGTSDYLRQLWSAQELTTDEAVVAWSGTGDPNVQDWHNMNWDANNVLTRGLYSRCYYEIALCNEFIRESAADKLNARLSGDDIAKAQQYRAEARFLRAVSYYHVLDLFGQGPFVTESGGVGFEAPTSATRQQLFTFVEDELLALDPLLVAPRANEYGRVDKAAAWGFLARLYLNAKVYTGQERNTDAAIQAKKVIDAGYALVKPDAATTVSSAYGRNFLADNNLAPTTSEIIWPIVIDGNTTRGYGATTFLVNGSTSSTNTGWQGVTGQTGGWNGLRTTSAFFDIFFKAGGDTTVDRRGRFWTKGQTREINELTQFSQGFGVLKYRNVTSTGMAIGASTNNFSSVDYPMLRVSDMMLTYAEAVVRGGSGSRPTALEYVNAIRARAFNNAAGSAITDGQLTTDFILDERARELFWEGYRRTDLIRYGRFTEGTYLWPWKGGASAGRGVEKFRELFAIPNSDLSANPNLKQNPGFN